jgi:hypothetical protein
MIVIFLVCSFVRRPLGTLKYFKVKITNIFMFEKLVNYTEQPPDEKNLSKSQPVLKETGNVFLYYGGTYVQEF